MAKRGSAARVPRSRSAAWFTAFLRTLRSEVDATIHGSRAAFLVPRGFKHVEAEHWRARGIRMIAPGPYTFWRRCASMASGRDRRMRRRSVLAES